VFAVTGNDGAVVVAVVVIEGRSRVVIAAVTVSVEGRDRAVVAEAVVTDAAVTGAAVTGAAFVAVAVAVAAARVARAGASVGVSVTKGRGTLAAAVLEDTKSRPDVHLPVTATTGREPRNALIAVGEGHCQAGGPGAGDGRSRDTSRPAKVGSNEV